MAGSCARAGLGWGCLPVHLGEVEGRDDPAESVAEGLSQAETHEQEGWQGGGKVVPGVQALGVGQAGCGEGGLSAASSGLPV